MWGEYILRGITNLNRLPFLDLIKVVFNLAKGLIIRLRFLIWGKHRRVDRQCFPHTTLTEGRTPPIKEERRSPTSLVPSMAVMPVTPARHLKGSLSSQCWTEGFTKSVSSHDVVGASKRWSIPNNGDHQEQQPAMCNLFFELPRVRCETLIYYSQ